MLVKGHKIIEATEQELFELYLQRGLDDIIDFPSYLRELRRLKVKIIEEGG